MFFISALKNLKMAKNMIFGQKMAKLKIFKNFRKKFFFKIDSESFKTHFKTKISKFVFCSKLIFCRLRLRNFRLGSSDYRSFQFRARLPNYRLQPSSEPVKLASKSERMTTHVLLKHLKTVKILFLVWRARLYK